MEQTTAVGVLLKEMAGSFHGNNLKKRAHRLAEGPLLYLVDIKRATPANLRAIAARKDQFLCDGAFSPNSIRQSLRRPAD